MHSKQTSDFFSPVHCILLPIVVLLVCWALYCLRGMGIIFSLAEGSSTILACQNFFVFGLNFSDFSAIE